MNFEKCKDCRYAKIEDPILSPDGVVTSPLKVYCKVTGDSIEVTTCVMPS